MSIQCITSHHVRSIGRKDPTELGRGASFATSAMVLADKMFLGRALRLVRSQESKALLKRNHQCPRRFTLYSQLRIISQGTPRPQLPFLHAAAAGRSILPRSQLQNKLTRFMSSETRQYYQGVLKQSLVVSAFFIISTVLFLIAQAGLQKEIMERKFPAPPEWQWMWRYEFSKAAANQIPNADGRLVDWAMIASSYLAILKKLEDPERGGKGLRPTLDDDGEIYVDGVGKAGKDLSGKSEPWRRGYHACLMGAAKAIEQVDGWLVDTTRNLALPPDFVVGPSNPHPEPMPDGSMEPPLEENCKPIFPEPTALYIKILTSQGFTSGQRLEAAVAYADWLDFKGLSSTAEEVYDWALDIAMGGLPIGANDIVDMKTGVINNKATYVSSNTLIATTALANHYARNNNLAAALPIFLSILRASRQLLLPHPPKPARGEESTGSSLMSMARSWLIVPPYPPPPPTGDDIPSRSQTAVCEEAAVLSHIGEILFASAKSRQSFNSGSKLAWGPQNPTSTTVSQSENFQSGLSWTRDAVDLAEETLASLGFSEKDQEARTKCMQCLSAGMENWSTMVDWMLRDERAAKATQLEGTKARVLFWGDSDNRQENQNRWEGEARVVDTRSRRIQRMLVSEQDRDLPLWMILLGKAKDI